MRALAFVAMGGALGSALRHLASGLVLRWSGDGFPWGTLAVNVIGSFLIGAYAGLASDSGRWLFSSDARLFLVTGFLGGFTTFSAFSLQTLNLLRNGDLLAAGGNVLGSVVLCLAFVWLGHALTLGLGR